MPGLMNIVGLISGSKFLWKVIRNWKVLSDSLTVISNTLKKMHDDKRNMPEAIETQTMLLALSNIIKTEIIDIPGVDEYELAVGLDNISNNITISIEDSKSDKFHQFTISKGT